MDGPVSLVSQSEISVSWRRDCGGWLAWLGLFRKPLRGVLRAHQRHLHGTQEEGQRVVGALSRPEDQARAPYRLNTCIKL